MKNALTYEDPHEAYKYNLKEPDEVLFIYHDAELHKVLDFVEIWKAWQHDSSMDFKTWMNRWVEEHT